MLARIPICDWHASEALQVALGAACIRMVGITGNRADQGLVNRISRTRGKAKMASKGQMTGMLGVYLVAVELTRKGFIVSPTSRSALGADLLVTDQKCKKAWSVQVKTNASNAAFWLTGANASELSSPTHIYVFVNAPVKKGAIPKFYIVPSSIVAKSVNPPSWSTSTSWDRVEKYEDNWKIFGDPRGAVVVKTNKHLLSVTR